MDTCDLIKEECIKTIDKSQSRIYHCIAQLNEDQIWMRDSSNVNSIGIIINHLCGNLQQWIISGIGVEKDIRNRPSEFKDEERFSKAELLNRFDSIIQKCKETIRAIKQKQLLERRRIQGFEETVFSALFSSITHLELHAGQIVYITRLLLQDKYELRWKPKTKEEGAE